MKRQFGTLTLLLLQIVMAGGLRLPFDFLLMLVMVGQLKQFLNPCVMKLMSNAAMISSTKPQNNLKQKHKPKDIMTPGMVLILDAAIRNIFMTQIKQVALNSIQIYLCVNCHTPVDQIRHFCCSSEEKEIVRNGQLSESLTTIKKRLMIFY